MNKPRRNAGGPCWGLVINYREGREGATQRGGWGLKTGRAAGSSSFTPTKRESVGTFFTLLKKGEGGGAQHVLR